MDVDRQFLVSIAEVVGKAQKLKTLANFSMPNVCAAMFG